MRLERGTQPDGWSPESTRLLGTLQTATSVFIEGMVELIAARVSERLHQETPPKQVKLLLTKQELAQAWSCSTSSIDRLRVEGLPTVLIGESPRFDPVAATEWLQAREAAR